MITSQMGCESAHDEQMDLGLAEIVYDPRQPRPKIMYRGEHEFAAEHGAKFEASSRFARRSAQEYAVGNIKQNAVRRAAIFRQTQFEQQERAHAKL